MYIKVMGNKYGKSDLIKGKLGLWFTNHLFTDSAGQMIMHKNKLKITPHIHVKDFTIKENFKWLKYTATFKSDGQYEYVIIGNFQPLMPQTAEMWTKKEGLTYRLDDMCLVPIRLKEYCSYTDSGEIFDLKNVYFDVNKYDLNKEGIKVLTDLALYLKDLNITLELTGYADSTGNEIENNDLSQNRAKEVYNFLLKEGMEATKITYKGEGSAKPIDTNDTEDGRKLNRRVEIKINIE
jgi:outer membrane protein OmpA-like peptidoglycan-associated protein